MINDIQQLLLQINTYFKDANLQNMSLSNHTTSSGWAELNMYY